MILFRENDFTVQMPKTELLNDMLIPGQAAAFESKQPVLLTQNESAKTGHFDSKEIQKKIPRRAFISGVHLQRETAEIMRFRLFGDSQEGLSPVIYYRCLFFFPFSRGFFFIFPDGLLPSGGAVCISDPFRCRIQRK